jgi:catechol 2,3-dioxygenase-like lactoylglutathione lyase family enzyme
MLTHSQIIGFVPITDARRAERFYVEALGLKFLDDVGFALVFECAGNTIRLVRMGSEFKSVPYTILGWEVRDLAASVARLTAAGVAFLRYPWCEQDAAGIWTAPNGDQVAWFNDPDGNVLSLSCHCA